MSVDPFTSEPRHEHSDCDMLHDEIGCINQGLVPGGLSATVPVTNRTPSRQSDQLVSDLNINGVTTGGILSEESNIDIDNSSRKSLKTVIAKKMAFVTFFFVVAFSLKDVHLLHATDNLVLAMECGVSMFISTYFRLRGKEEHKILDCKGTDVPKISCSYILDVRQPACFDPLSYIRELSLPTIVPALELCTEVHGYNHELLMLWVSCFTYARTGLITRRSVD
ncbi:hypothetical protein M405DRAFT_845663 [Rhizopogon salebrosus TDB-379]|nr:hypothetical protein M405DRAFT_845663 [Rhizopogon salebrosus TDB-379]